MVPTGLLCLSTVLLLALAGPVPQKPVKEEPCDPKVGLAPTANERVLRQVPADVYNEPPREDNKSKDADANAGEHSLRTSGFQGVKLF